MRPAAPGRWKALPMRLTPLAVTQKPAAYRSSSDRPVESAVQPDTVVFAPITSKPQPKVSCASHPTTVARVDSRNPGPGVLLVESPVSYALQPSSLTLPPSAKKPPLRPACAVQPMTTPSEELRAYAHPPACSTRQESTVKLRSRPG